MRQREIRELIDPLLPGLADRPTVPLPSSSQDGLIFTKDGWSFYAINGLWADEPNSDGDVYVVTPSGNSLHAIWDVARPGNNSVEFLNRDHLQLAFHISHSVRNWDELAFHLIGLIPTVSTKFK
jgi:hypothetical protein